MASSTIDEGALNKGQLRKLNALRRSVGADIGARGVEALVETRRLCRRLVDLQLVALVGVPLTGPEGAGNRRALAAALAAGADLVGGAPALDPRPAECVAVCLDAAAEAGLAVDLHVDETLDPDVRSLAELARGVLDRGFPHPVTASHCVSLGMMPEADQREIATLVAEAGVGVVTLPQTNLFLQSRGRRTAPPRGLTALAALAEERRFDADGVITRQFAPATHLFLVGEGAVRFQLRLEEGNEDLDVGERSIPWTAVGWSGFRDLRRYATTVVCTRACRTLRFEHTALAALFDEQPRLGVVFLESILRQCFERLADMRARLTAYSQTPVNFGRSLQDEGEEETYNRAPPPLIELLRRSSFFAPLEEERLRLFAGAVESRYFCRGEPIVEQGSPEAGLWVLATGRVALNYSPPSTSEAFALRTISEPGSVVAMAGLPGVDAHGASVVATRDCTVYRIDTERLEPVLRETPGLALALARRILWLVSMHLRAARALFISRRFEKERLAVANLLEQSCTQLSVHSPLHTVPPLLGPVGAAGGRSSEARGRRTHR